MSISTYSEFQSKAASEKIALVQLDASKRLVGFEVYSGSIYKLTNFTFPIIVSIKDSGTALSSVSSVGAVTAGTYFIDTANSTLYVRTSDSAHPNGKFLACVFRLFYSNVPINLSYDLSSGADVEWLPLVKSTSEFGVELDNQNQLGIAIEGSGYVEFFNDQDYWKPIYDKYYFENQTVRIYSFNRELPVSEAKLLFIGRIQGKTYKEDSVRFNLKDIFNELRAPVELENVGGFELLYDLLLPPIVARVPSNLERAKQRLIYGYVYGFRPTNIDQIVDGYVRGFGFNVTPGSTTVTSVEPALTAYLSPEDEISFQNDPERFYTIASIDSSTQLTLTEAIDGPVGYVLEGYQKPKYNSSLFNRYHLLAGHKLKEPTTTVVSSLSPNLFTVASATDFLVNDRIVVDDEETTIVRISGDVVKVTPPLTTNPAPGTTVTRPSVTKVYLNGQELTRDRDWGVFENQVLFLTTTCEFNIASIVKGPGTSVTFNGTTAVSGSGTFFKTDLKPGDWIRDANQSNWYNVLSIHSDTALTLRNAAGYSSTATNWQIRRPDYYSEGKSVLSCDLIGATDDGESDGEFLNRPTEIVADLVRRAGLSDLIDTDSFAAAAETCKHRIGIAIPDTYSSDKAPSYRDVINRINKSVLGALVQSPDFEIQYSIFEPVRSASNTKLVEHDILKFSIESSSDRIVKTVNLSYLNKEYDYSIEDEGVSVMSATSDNATYLALTTKEVRIPTLLVDESSAEIYAKRWAFIFEVSSSVIKLESKMQLARAQVTQVIELQHEKLYERIGSQLSRKIGAIQKASRTALDSAIEIEDLSNSFSRCAVITENTAGSFENATDDEKIYNGFITDNYGMQDNDPETFNTNLIW